MLDFFREKMVVIKYETPTKKDNTCWGGGRFVSYSRLFLGLVEELRKEYGKDNFYVTDVIKL